MKIPWKMILIGTGCLFILLLVGSLTGANQKLLDLARDQLKSDQARVVEVQGENQKWYEETIASLNEQLETTKKKIGILEITINDKDGEILALRNERGRIVTSSDPDSIVDDLRQLGYRSEYRRRR